MITPYSHIDLKLGRESFEKIPELEQPQWAWNILSKLTSYIKSPPASVLELKEIVTDQGKWKDAHQQFTKIRVFSLENEDFEPKSYLFLAEKVAKITYNASNEPAPFDHDSGWYIRDQAVITARLLNEPGLEEEVIRAVEAKM
jgi:hypothetical protein